MIVVTKIQTRLKQLARPSYLWIQFLVTTRWRLLWTRPLTQAAVSRLLAEWLNEDWNAQVPPEGPQASLKLPPVAVDPADPSVPPQDSNAGAILMPLWRAKCDFAANDYGADYVDLRKGDPVELVEPPAPLHVDHQWNYGRVEDRTG